MSDVALSLLLVTHSYLKMQGEYFRTIPRVSEAPPTPSLKEFTFQLFKILHFVSTKGTWKSNGKESKELLFHIIYLSFVARVVYYIFLSIHSIRYINCKISWALTVKTNNLFCLYLSSFTLAKRNPQVVPKMSFTCREEGKDDV